MTLRTPLGAGCYRLPAEPPVAAVPSRFVTATRAGWDAGAHSEAQLDGDLRLTFTVNDSIAVVCGFTPADTAPSADPGRITHGFYVTRVQGVLSLFVYESGASVFGPRAVSVGDTLDVLRLGQAVIYRRNGFSIYTSRTKSTGVIKVGASLYGPEDSIG